MVDESKTQRYLLQIHVGPVQEFIASARRSRDLWYGSWMLSEFARAAAKAIQDAGGTLIFPSPDGFVGAPATPPQTQKSVANKIVAVIDSDEILNRLTATINGQAADVERAIRDRLRELREEAFDRVQWNADENEYRSLAIKQIDDLPEIYWAAVPYPRDDMYQFAHKQLEALMTARKATRDFGQIDLSNAPGGGRIPKSSLDGTRESVIPRRVYQDQQALFNYFGAKQAEQLSGVDLLKRQGYREKQGSEIADFPSTSHFAAIPFLARIAKKNSDLSCAFSRLAVQLRGLGIRPQKLAQQYQQLSYIGGYDASVLFESRLADEIDAPATEGGQQKLRAARTHLQGFFDAVAEPQRPEPYYALLHADGDRMGQVIDNQPSDEAHQKLSEVIDKFASGVRAIVEKHEGALVYAGGDDVLAFLPLHTVLECAQALHNSFDQHVGSATFNNQPFRTANGEAPTLSVGIVICHHLEPLNDALRLLRDAEKAAKKVGGKNGLAITLSKRSGADRTITGSWQGRFFPRLQMFVDLHRAEAIPDGAAYDLRNLAERLDVPEKDAGYLTIQRAMRREAGRILGRKRGARGSQSIPDDVLDLIARDLSIPELEQSSPDSEQTLIAHCRQWGIADLANEMIVAREFARAKGPQPLMQKEQAA